MSLCLFLHRALFLCICLSLVCLPPSICLSAPLVCQPLLSPCLSFFSLIVCLFLPLSLSLSLSSSSSSSSSFSRSSSSFPHFPPLPPLPPPSPPPSPPPPPPPPLPPPPLCPLRRLSGRSAYTGAKLLLIIPLFLKSLFFLLLFGWAKIGRPNGLEELGCVG